MFFRIGSFEVFTEPASAEFSFFEVDHIKHNEADRELWLLGRHIVISRLVPRMHSRTVDGKR